MNYLNSAKVPAGLALLLLYPSFGTAHGVGSLGVHTLAFDLADYAVVIRVVAAVGGEVEGNG